MNISRISLSDVANGSIGAPTLFICSASFEERCLSVPDAVAQLGVPGCTVLVSFNEDYEEEAQVNLRKLKQIFPNALTCRLRTDDPILTMDHLSEGIGEAWKSRPSGTVFVDITTFTRESLLILLQCLWRTASRGDKVMLFYSRVREYDVGRSEENKWLSKGIREVRSVLGFPGDLKPSLPTHLIVMAGFEGDRAVALVTKFEPSFVSLGVADSSEGDTRNHQSINESRMRQMSHEVGNLAIPIWEFKFSGYDPQRTSVDLLEQIDRVQSECQNTGGVNTIIAPMNTKLSTVGSALVGMRKPTIQLCYAQADLYNYRTYSEPGDTVYSFELPNV